MAEENALIQDSAEGAAPESTEAPPEPDLAVDTVAAGEEPDPDKPIDEPPETGEDEQLEKDIADLKAKKEKAEDEVKYWNKQKRDARRDHFRTAEPPAEAEEELPAEAPKEEDFDTYEQYQDAVVDFKVDSKIANYEVKQAKKGRQQGIKTFVQDLVTDGIAKFEDFEEVALSDAAPVTNQMVEIFQDCENPVDVAYHLGQNPQIAVSISRMTRDAAVREITKIDLEIGASGPAAPAAAPSNKPVTKAPPPIKPTRSENVISKDPDKMTQAEYEKWREDGGGR